MRWAAIACAAGCGRGRLSIWPARGMPDVDPGADDHRTRAESGGCDVVLWDAGSVAVTRSTDSRLRVVYLGVFGYGVVVHVVYLTIGRTFAEWPLWAMVFANSLVLLDAVALLALVLFPLPGRWVAAGVLVADAAFNVWANAAVDSGPVEWLGTAVICILAAGSLCWALSGPPEPRRPSTGSGDGRSGPSPR